MSYPVFQHMWLDHENPHICAKCKCQLIKDSYMYCYMAEDQFELCGDCYMMLLGDIHGLVLEFVDRVPKIRTTCRFANDEAVMKLLKSDHQV